MTASTIPVAGPLVAALVSAGAEAFVDWLRGFLSKPDLELYLDPTKQLTDDFVADLTRAAIRQRIVLMVDTYEQMTTLDDWLRDLVRRLPENVLLVIAGRVVPEWDRVWSGWMGRAEIIEQKEMTPDDLHLLVRRYYAYIHGGEPDPQQVEAVAQFARGLPMVATTVVRLWVKHGVEDFATVKPQVVADLVDRLLEGVPQEMRPAFEAAAVLRYFNADSLRALLEGGDADKLYFELRRWPFIRPRREGLAIHDTMREMMNEALRLRTPERFFSLHEQAAAHYELRSTKVATEEYDQLTLERLYHLIQSGREHLAISESHHVIDIAMGYYRRTFAENVIALLDQHLRQDNSRRWLAYLRYLVIIMDPSIEKQLAQIRELVSMLRESGLDPALWALTASILAEIPVEANIPVTQQIEWLTKAMNSGILPPQEKTKGYVRLGYLSRATDLKKAHDYFTEALNSAQQQGDLIWQIRALDGLAYNHLLRGDWGKAAKWAQEGITLSRDVGEYGLTTALKHAGWALIYKGDLNSALRLIQEALEISKQRQDESEGIRLTRRLAEIYDRQGLWVLSNVLYQRLAQKDKELGRIISQANNLGLLGISYLEQGSYQNAKDALVESLSNAHLDFQPRVLNALGEVHLRIGSAHEARQYFERAISASRGNSYYIAQSQLGLLQVDFGSAAFDQIPQRAKQVEVLSIDCGYYDHLALLYLMQGNVAWDGHIPEWDSSFDATLHFYQRALIYALRYNRFLLDRVLSGQPQGTPLCPIIPHCLRRGEEDRRMLIALGDWWKSGRNDIGTPRPNTISPIQEGIPLVEAERIAREREPGDNSPQRTVVEQIETALESGGA